MAIVPRRHRYRLRTISPKSLSRRRSDVARRSSLVRDLRRRRLHDDHLRLRTGRSGDRRRCLPVVHLSAHLALQARGIAEAALEAPDRLVHAHAVQRVLQDSLSVARVKWPNNPCDEARAIAITSSRALGDRAEVAGLTARRVHAVAAIFRASEECVVHRGHLTEGGHGRSRGLQNARRGVPTRTNQLIV